MHFISLRGSQPSVLANDWQKLNICMPKNPFTWILKCSDMLLSFLVYFFLWNYRIIHCGKGNALYYLTISPYKIDMAQGEI